ncbi:hypothetical protein CPB84DRAFT_1745385 [Gymnopilus junonius]|uniref:Nephrocystin 3-like N-terminal domain-containing protein n=1 Tax=Gymnopilus junonius TaxID=109634 RepID=A0A9P5TRK8_GYMJU|nr:hypothetical protein CPB84DRAFT_1745385 [Gymnopilus junonius]
MPEKHPDPGHYNLKAGIVKGARLEGHKTRTQSTIIPRHISTNSQVSYVAGNAMHNSAIVSSQAKCHPGTREAVLDRLVKPRAKFCRALHNHNLSLSIPVTKPYIENAVQRDSHIIYKSPMEQAFRLIIEPLSMVVEEGDLEAYRCPRVIIVDGLDECLDSSQQFDILDALLYIIKEAPIPIAVIVASRPEPDIRGAFSYGGLEDVSSPITLDNSFNPDADIKKYLIDTFRFICHNHPLKSTLPTTEWPSAETIDKLVEKASGQFIYASTIEKFVSSARHKPAERLSIVLGNRAAEANKPFSELDNLYSTIFYSIEKKIRKFALRTLGVSLVPFARRVREPGTIIETRSPSFLEKLLHLKPGDIQMWLIDLHSLIAIGEGHEEIHFYHASLSDYLRDSSRSGQFYISVRYSRLYLFKHCVQHLLEKDGSKGLVLHQEQRAKEKSMKYR